MSVDSGYGIDRGDFLHRMEVAQALPDTGVDIALFGVVAPDWTPVDESKPFTGVPPEKIAEAVDILEAKALGWTAYWASITPDAAAAKYGNH